MRSLLALLLTLPLALTEPKFVAPAAGSTLPAGTITVRWKDGGSPPSISDLSSYQLRLFTGSNSKPFQLADLNGGSFAGSDSISVTVPSSAGGSSPKNAYFIGMIATSSSGTITVFSDRFTLNRMAGTFPAAIEPDLASISGTSGPSPVNVQVDERQDQRQEEQQGAGAGPYAIPYLQQTGLTRYAPMQKIPGTKITATNTAPLYALSSVILASKYLPSPTVVTTFTESQTFVAASHPNTVAPASHPTDTAMQRVLNRWKD